MEGGGGSIQDLLEGSARLQLEVRRETLADFHASKRTVSEIKRGGGVGGVSEQLTLTAGSQNEGEDSVNTNWDS